MSGGIWDPAYKLQRTLATTSLVLMLAWLSLGLAPISAMSGGGNHPGHSFPSFQAAAILVAMLVSTQHKNSVAYRILNWQPVDTLVSLVIHFTSGTLYSYATLVDRRWRALLYNWRGWWLAALAVAMGFFLTIAVERPIRASKKDRVCKDHD